jgi:Tfp pilus assembly protein PilN
VTRFDYRQSAFERLLGRPPRIALDGRLRASLLTLAVALVAVAVVATAERSRLARLDAELAAMHDRLIAAEQSDARDERVRRDVLAARGVRDAVLDARRASIADANAIARLGNRLPPQTWLTSLSAARTGTWSIGGRSTQLEQVGATLATIGRLDPAASPRLVSLEANGERGRLLDFRIAWDPVR